MDTMESTVEKLEAQLKQWGAKVDALAAKADTAGTEAKVEYRKGVNELKAKYADAQAKIVELKAAGSDKWETFRAGVETAWRDLEVSFKKLAS